MIALGISTGALARVDRVDQHVQDTHITMAGGALYGSSVTYLYNETSDIQHYTVHIQICADGYGCSTDAYRERYLKPGESATVKQENGFWIRYSSPQTRDFSVITWTHKGHDIQTFKKTARVSAY